MLRNNKGQGMVEYILIIVLVVIVVIAGVKMFGGKVNNMFQDSTQKISTEANVK
ncbi:MAG: Flp family type IVb pilin [Elusimicrobia bacterium]|jgi:Flp pilus assembly pilin Flp|nr:Flp family type IVb pilin [Elusimicrobiota bacterium]